MSGEQLGQTDKLNSKTSRQTKFGQKLLSHIQHHSTIESGTGPGKWNKPLVLTTKLSPSPAYHQALTG